MWERLVKERWDQNSGKETLKQPVLQATIKLAAVVLGVPFFNKVNRLAWCAVWRSLLHTWNVARGFAADTKERPEPVELDEPSLPSKNAARLVPITKKILSEIYDDVQHTGYELLSTTTTTDLAGFKAKLNSFAPDCARFI